MDCQERDAAPGLAAAGRANGQDGPLEYGPSVGGQRRHARNSDVGGGLGEVCREVWLWKDTQGKAAACVTIVQKAVPSEVHALQVLSMILIADEMHGRGYYNVIVSQCCINHYH